MPPTAPEDVNLDELRRRARRRLVGAIVLALVVAVAVPMLLESDPKPLGEDVSVKIPPIDEGKFVNRLNEKEKDKAPPKGEPAKVAAPKPAPEAARVEPPKPAPAEPVKAAEAQAAPPPEAAKTEPPKEAAREPVAGEFSVQVFAFSDDKGANSLVRKLKDKGFPAYSEPVTTSKGTLWRVRVGPFPTREAAFAAHGKLKGEGYNGIVQSAK